MSLKPISSFGEAALMLDAEFAELERLAEKIERLSLQTEQGPKRTAEVIQEALQCHKRLVNGMVRMGECLEEARAKSEKAMLTVGQKANALEEHQKEAERLSHRFQALGEMVREVSTAIAGIKPGSDQATDEEQAVLSRILPEFNEKMDVLVNEATQLMQDARTAHIKMIESSADSLRQTLEAARRRLNSFERQAQTQSRSSHLH